MELYFDLEAATATITGDFDQEEFNAIMAQILPEHQLICMPPVDEMKFVDLGRHISYDVRKAINLEQAGNGFLAVPYEINVQYVSAVMSE